MDARILINAAGLYADVINNMLSGEPFTITPKRGEYFLLDQTEGGLVSRTLFQLPDQSGKGVFGDADRGWQPIARSKFARDRR